MKNQPNISKLIESGESETLEFKISFGKEVLETVCAFANTKGGIIIIGVSDDVIVQGVETGKETLQNIQNQIKQGIQPNVIPEVYSTENDGKLLIIINVDEFPVKPVSFKGRYFKRINNSNHLLDINEIANLYLKTFNLSWDSYPYPSSSIADIDKEKVYSFIEKVNKEERFSLPSDFESSLLKLKLIKENKPTAAAMLLFATHALNYKIHIGRFKSPTNIIDDKQIEDTLFEANDQALKFILNYIKVSFELADRSNEGVNEGVNELHKTIKKYPNNKTPFYSGKLNVPVKTIERWIKTLKEKNLIEFKGSPKTGGYFVK